MSIHLSGRQYVKLDSLLCSEMICTLLFAGEYIWSNHFWNIKKKNTPHRKAYMGLAKILSTRSVPVRQYRSTSENEKKKKKHSNHVIRLHWKFQASHDEQKVVKFWAARWGGKKRKKHSHRSTRRSKPTWTSWATVPAHKPSHHARERSHWSRILHIHGHSPAEKVTQN